MALRVTPTLGLVTNPRSDSEAVEIVQSEARSGPAAVRTASPPIEVPSIAEPVPEPAVERATDSAADGAGANQGRLPRSAAHATSLIGSVDYADHDQITGWAWDPARPDEAIDIEILDDELVVLKICADELRSDLVQAGAGSGCHGFFLRNLSGVFPLSRHRVRVRRAFDGHDLPGSPVWIARPALDYRATDFMQQVVLSAVQTAATPDDLAEPLSHLLRLLNDVINAQVGIARAQSDQQAVPATETAVGLQLSGQTQELVRRLHYAHAPLYFEPSEEPEVSVIIPVHNKFAYTYACLKSIALTLPKRTFEIVIVDDCSDDETVLCALVFAGAVRIVRNAKNLGFVRTCNAGAAEARGRYLFFLNNDTLMKEGWLDALVETFEEVPNIGVVGAKLLFENGKLQEAGGIIWRLGDGWNWGRERDPAEPAYCFLRDADWVSGAALMIERSMFRELGGFDELFAPGYYEDTDLAFRVRARGRRVVVQPASRSCISRGSAPAPTPRDRA